MEDPIPAFISYSHDSPAHKARVETLSNQLRGDGIDCEIDQYQISPAEGWPTWMLKQIRRARFVLVVCTEKYFKRVTGQESGGLGSKWEGALITQELYESSGANTKFIPVLFRCEDQEYRPLFLRG